MYGKIKFTRTSFILHFLLLWNVYNALRVTQQKAPEHARILTQGRHHNNLIAYLYCVFSVFTITIDNAVSILHNLIG